MLNIIKKLHNKSEEYRRTVAIIASISVTIVILVVWVSVMQKNIFFIDSVIVDNKKTETASPIQSLKSGFIRLTSSVSDQVSSTIDSLGEIEYKKEINE